MTECKTPTDLGPAGLGLWESLHAKVDFGPHELRLVEDAARVTDIIDRLDKAALDEPLITKGSTGQPVISPVIAEARVQRRLLADLLAAVKIPLSDDREAEQAKARSEQARKAAFVRHGK
jgi:hypothetical protein